MARVGLKGPYRSSGSSAATAVAIRRSRRTPRMISHSITRPVQLAPTTSEVPCQRACGPYPGPKV
ncbi:hypothetical protein AB0L86_18260 [Micromonospora musae]|uniref:hypothetical protein n=1 Tax=Micromonospora musae TaxID=1894970 RepID=UPI00341C6A75